MPATAALSVISAATPKPGAAADARATSPDASRAFDNHLDAARQQQSGNRDASSDTASRDSADAHQAAASTAAGRADKADKSAKSDKADNADTATTSDAATDAPAALAADAATHADVGISDPSSTATGSPTDDGKDAPPADAISIAGAMLALLGQAMPAKASVPAGGAAKVMAASVLKASLGGTPAGASPTADAGAAPTGDAAGQTGANASAVTAQGSSGQVAFNDLFATGLSRAALRHDDKGTVDALASLLPATPQGNAATLVPATHALTLPSPVGSADFTQQLGQQVAWLGGQDIKQARIKLHPEELGSLDVKVNVQHNGQVDVTFAAQHPATVHALQQTLPQLDALLAQQGLSLGQAQVGQQSAGGGDARGQSGGPGSGVEGADAGIDEVGAAPAAISAMGLLDAFA